MWIRDLFRKAIPLIEPDINKGDKCRDKVTGVYSTCLHVDRGVYYGKINHQLTKGKITNFEKL